MSCPICRSPSRKAIDAMLASDGHSSPNRIARTLVGFSRPQIKRHRDWCLGKVPRIMFSVLHDGKSEEDVAVQLEAEGESPKQVEFTLGVVRSLLDKEGPA